MTKIDLVVNGRRRSVDTDSATPLLYVLRDELELNGAKFGCGLGQCGACTVMLDGAAVFSCLTPLLAVQNRSVTTVEGLGDEKRPGPVQQAFIEKQAAQCGYCTAGMVMRAQALLQRDRNPDEQTIREHMKTNLCRCGTQMRILAAVRRASELMNGSGAHAPTAGAD